MKNALIIINGFAKADGIKNQITRLTEELTKRGCSIDVKKNTEILAYIKEGNIECSLPKYDFVLYLDKDKYMAEMLEKYGYVLYNSAEATRKCDDKMLTHIALSNAGIKMPTTISSTLCYNDNGNRDHLKIVAKKLGFPMIVKENYGSLGKQVHLINNEKELNEIENKLLKIPHIFQQFISSSKGKDYRVVVIGNKVIAYMKRENKNSYLSNLAAGGTSSIVEISEEFKQTAIKCSEVLGLDYCGVDILEGPKGEPVVSEVNSNAFYEGIEKTTGINVAAAYVEHILSKN